MVVRRLLSAAFATAVVLGAAACTPAAGPVPIPTASPSMTPTPTATVSPTVTPTPSTTSTASTSPAGDLPTPDPGYTAHFRKSFYVDSRDEYGPFGTPDAVRILTDAAAKRDTFDRCTTVRDLAEADGQDWQELKVAVEESAEAAATAMAYGFALPYLTGHLDTAGKRLLTDAIYSTQIFYAENDVQQLATMLKDVKSFDTSDC